MSIDPGNEQTAYTLIDDDLKILEFGKICNEDFIELCYHYKRKDYDVAIEMIASYGMAVGKEVFETCVMIGRIYEIFNDTGMKPTLIYRKEVKLNLCNSVRAKDGNIIQALKDRFGDRGTKKAQGWFYGVKADVWQAYAVGITYHDTHRKLREI